MLKLDFILGFGIYVKGLVYGYLLNVYGSLSGMNNGKMNFRKFSFVGGW